MTAVWILATIFAFIIITTYISEKEKTKRQKMKIEATLRSEKMAISEPEANPDTIRSRSASTPAMTAPTEGVSN